MSAHISHLLHTTEVPAVMGLSPTTVVANGSPKRANLGCISQIDDTPETDGNINELAKFDCGKYYYYYYGTQLRNVHVE